MPSERPAARVVTCNREGTRPPVVLVHTWDTDIKRLHALADHLGEDQPVHGIEPPRPEDGPMPATTAEWVAHARQGLERLPVTSPFRLAGFSFGGVVALELARTLVDEGGEIAWLGLIDTLRPRLNPKGVGPYLRYHAAEVADLPDATRQRAYVTHLVKGGTRRTVLKVKRRARPALVRLGVRHEQATGPVLGPKSTMSPQKKAIWLSYLNYLPKPFDHPVALFAGDDNRREAAGDPSLRWSKFLRGGYELAEVEGKHLELFTPDHIHSVGDAVAASLARSQPPA